MAAADQKKRKKKKKKCISLLASSSSLSLIFPGTRHCPPRHSLYFYPTLFNKRNIIQPCLYRIRLEMEINYLPV